MPFFYFSWRDRHSITKFFSVELIVLSEVHIYKASKSMSIPAISNSAILILMFINNLLSDSFIFRSIVLVGCWSLSSLKVLLNSLSLMSIKLGFFDLRLPFFHLFILIFRLSNLISMLFDKLIIFLHYFIHILIIYINICYIFTLYECLIFFI